MLKATKAILAVIAIVATSNVALADREELNSGFHGNTPYQQQQITGTIAQNLRATFASSGHIAARPAGDPDPRLAPFHRDFDKDHGAW